MIIATTAINLRNFQGKERKGLNFETALARLKDNSGRDIVLDGGGPFQMYEYVSTESVYLNIAAKRPQNS